MSQVFQMVITSDNPDRYLPGSWNFECDSSDPRVIWETAQAIANSDNVNLVRIVDSRGKLVIFK